MNWKRPTPPALPLPKDIGRAKGAYWATQTDFVNELGQILQGQRVLEVFSGNGLLAAALKQRGIQVTATTLFSGHDAHEFGLYHPVQEMDAVHAVEAYGPQADVLLMCWPTTTPRAAMAARLWSEQATPARPIVYIGEYTDYDKSQLGGCATDEFFECLHIYRRIESYRSRPCEYAVIGKFIP